MRIVCIACHGKRRRPARRPRQRLHGNHSEERTSIKSRVNGSRGDVKDLVHMLELCMSSSLF